MTSAKTPRAASGSAKPGPSARVRPPFRSRTVSIESGERRLFARVEDLRELEGNARVHGRRNLDAIRASIEAFDEQKPLVVTRAGTVLSGNGRLAAAKESGREEVWVTVSELEGDAARAFALADNRTGDLSRFDDELLAAELQKIARSLPELVMPSGFSQAELHRLGIELGDATRADGGTAEASEPPVEPVARRNDLWHLGEHRLLCGDATSTVDLTRLFWNEKGTNEKAVLLATDPPYGIAFEGGSHPPTKSNNEGRDKAWGRAVDPELAPDFFTAWLRACLEACSERAPVYQWHSPKRRAALEEGWNANGLLLHQDLVWTKNRAVLTYAHFMIRHEVCAYGWRQGFQPETDRRPPSDATTVWVMGHEQDGIHPTQKPLELFERPIAYHTKEGEIVLEPFSGSGSQLMAAEKLGRRCFALEIAPGYVDVAIARWQESTGRAATLGPLGPTFVEVEQERAKKTKRRRAPERSKAE